MVKVPWYQSGALGSVSYRNFLTGNILAQTAFWSQRVATGWIAWEMTQSPFWLSLVAFSDLFPVLVMGPIAGAVADRHDKLAQVRICQALSAVQGLILFGLALMGWLTLPALLVLALALGVIQSFDQPARLSLVGLLVDRPQMSSAVAINAVVFNFARFLAPVVTGIAVALHSAALASAFTAVCFLAAMLLLSRVKTKPDNRAIAERKSFLGDLAAGVRYTFTHEALLISLALITAVNVGARPILELLPALSSEVFRVDASGFAGLGAAMGAGAALGALLLVFFTQRVNLVMVAIGCGVGVTVSAVAICLAGQYWQGLVAMFFLGAALTGCAVAVQSMVQLTAADAMKGRVLSLYGMLFRAGPATGTVAIGSAAEFAGLQIPIAVAAALMAIVTLWAFVQRRKVTAALARASEAE
ncbi:MAG: major facilitator family protein [Devosia sp.]|uniref:MFS transporter n=1 Tax=Devosia sp. TaxID=1871048 RepID=UPI00262A2413|nr:MFS transporter [Devosia sp.]MDB5538595.1 major facilitator family protein [Devosia sp.]